MHKILIYLVSKESKGVFHFPVKVMHLESAIKFGILNKFSEFGSYRMVAKEYWGSLSIT